MEKRVFKLWRLATVGAVLIALGMVSCNIHVDYRISQAIKQGSGEVEARLAFSNAGYESERIIKLMKP